MARIELRHVNKTVVPEMRMTFLPSSLMRGSSATKKKAPFQIRDVDLKVPNGKTMVILGPSGCGKTTLLRIIAGLEPLDSGQILFDGHDIADIPTGERGIGMVFQNYALYPNFSTDDNVLSFFKFRKKTPELDEEAREKYERTSKLMGVEITHLMGRFPANLSGGERQRVALARCITRDPQVFLMDEPFSNLDQRLREKYRVNLKHLLQHFKITTLYVTHDQNEAIMLADLIAIMDAGRIVQTGSYQDIYLNPKDLFTAEFLNLDYETTALNRLPGESFALNLRGKILGVRPEDAEPVPANTPGAFLGMIKLVIPNPLRKRTVLHVQYGEFELQMSLVGMGDYLVGEKINFKFNRIHVFNEKSGRREDTLP